MHATATASAAHRSRRRSRRDLRTALGMGVRALPRARHRAGDAEGAADKFAAFERLCQRAQVAARACACVGDDLPDVPLLAAVGLAFAVADAHPLARRAAHDFVTALPGGMGAVREVCDRLLAAHARRGAAL